MKNLLIGISALIVVGGLWYWSKSLSDRKRAWKSLPIKYAYHLHTRDSSFSRAFASEDVECLLKIKEYYKKDSEGAEETYIPFCFDFVVDYKVPVHIMSEYDSITVKVVYFRPTQDGREKDAIGYMLKSTLHDAPYNEKKGD